MIKRLVVIAALAVATCLCQQNDGSVQFTAAGSWIFCERDGALCLGPQPTVGKEPDFLLVQAKNSDTVGFVYTITGTHPDGTVVSLMGGFNRNAQDDWSYTIVYAGIVLNLKITIMEVPANATMHSLVQK